MKKKIMVIAAHPDDEILGCGATIAKLIKTGKYECRTIILNKGMTSRGKEYLNVVDKLIEDSHKANDIIGINSLKHYDFWPNCESDSISLLKIVKIIENEIFNYNPTIIFTHFANDLNIDHRKTFEAVMTACRPNSGFNNPDIYSFFVPSSTDWIDGSGGNSFVPNVYVDIQDYLRLKLDSLNCYQTEMKKYPHSRSIKSIEIFNQYWGNRVGLEAAEPFILIRKVATKDDI